MDKNTAVVAGVFVALLLIVVLVLALRRPTVAAGQPASNAWDALIGLGGAAADAYGARA